MKKIAIIGFGFSGTMTAVHLIKNAALPFELILIENRERFNKGIAYLPYSKKHILNVVASRMSAFPDKADHFVNWASQQDEFSGTHRNLLENAYLPRAMYGQYLAEIWKKALQSSAAQKVRVIVKDAQVLKMDVSENEISLALSNNENLTADYCVIATGNNLPGNPDIPNTNFFNSPHYFRNPWDANAVANCNPKVPVLILGNGLSMVDTVMGLIEKGFGNTIHSLSPHGFSLMPNKYAGFNYSVISGELNNKKKLLEILRIVNRHIRLGRKLGFNGEPIVDAMRPFTQHIWQNLTTHEKRLFITRLRHAWDTARHRIPAHIHAHICDLKKNGILYTYAGKLTDISNEKGLIKVNFFDNLQVKENELNVFALGSLLKGVLWESTAVKELREQAETVANQLIKKIHSSS